VQCAAGGGNFLLNVGPDPDGRIPAESRTRLAEIGRWLALNGDAIYGTGDTPSLRHVQFPPDTPWGGGPATSPTIGHVATIQGTRLNIYVGEWQGEQLAVGNLAFEVTSARLLGSGTPIPFQQIGSRLVLRGLPRDAPDPLGTMIVLQADRPPATVDRFAPAIRPVGR
jgi:alpha-L-fucosidase